MEESIVPVGAVDLQALAEKTLAIVRKIRIDLEQDLARTVILLQGQTIRADKLMNRLEKMRDFFCDMRVYIRKTHKKCPNKETCDTCRSLAVCEATLNQFRWE